MNLDAILAISTPQEKDVCNQPPIRQPFLLRPSGGCVDMNFRAWLLAQRNRRDPVGDLARDARQDLRDGGWREWAGGRHFTPHNLAHRMWDAGACDAAFEALARAEREWKEMR